MENKDNRFIKRGRAPLKFFLISVGLSAALLLTFWGIIAPILQHSLSRTSIIGNTVLYMTETWFDISIEFTIMGTIIYNLFFCQQMYPDRIPTRRAYFETVLYGGGLFLLVAACCMGVAFALVFGGILAVLGFVFSSSVPTGSWLLERFSSDDWRITKL